MIVGTCPALWGSCHLDLAKTHRASPARITDARVVAPPSLSRYVDLPIHTTRRMLRCCNDLHSSVTRRCASLGLVHAGGSSERSS
jgi:hypothetical protein